MSRRFVERNTTALKERSRESESIPFDEDDPDADMRAELHETTAESLDYYGRASAAADQ